MSFIDWIGRREQNARLFLDQNPADGSTWVRIGNGCGLRQSTDVDGPFTTVADARVRRDMLSAEHRIMIQPTVIG